MEVMRAAERIELAGSDVLHLEVGQPATSAPRGVIKAAKHALDTNVLGYTTPLGHPALREAIVEHYASWYDLTIDTDQVVVTAGASGGCVLSFLAAFAPGDRVVVPSPGYPCYRNILEAFGVTVVDLLLDASDGFVPTPALLETLGEIEGVVLASPANPTGTMLSEDAMRDLATWCHSNEVRLISDEIYHGITYGAAAPSALAHSSSAIAMNSFSKYFSMTGWRLGWLIVPPEFTEAMVRLGANLFISPTTLSQLGAVAAFSCHDELMGNVERYAKSRQILLDGLPTIGLDRLAPADGAFYIYAAVDHLSADSQQLCASWLNELGLAVTPGVDFDPTRGHEWVRFSFAGDPANMTKAIDRLAGWKSKL